MTQAEEIELLGHRTSAGPSVSVLPHPSAGEWLTDLRVDQTDPFFFDHPLDHVPGMLLVCAMADQARDHGAVPEHGRVKGSVNFRTMSGFGPGLLLRGEPAENGRRNLRITQQSTLLADGWFEMSPEAGWPLIAGAPRPEPAEAVLVHRSRSENIMLGEPTVTEEQVTAAVLVPPDGHALCGRRAGRRSVRAVVEAGRQLSVWLTHRLGGWPLGTQILWLRLTADLPLGLPSSIPVTLRWQAAGIPDSRARLRFDVIAGDGAAEGGGRKVGSLVYMSMGLQRDEYQSFQATRSAL